MRNAADKVLEGLDQRLVCDGVLDERVDLRKPVKLRVSERLAIMQPALGKAEIPASQECTPLTDRDHPHRKLVERDRVPRRLCQIARNLARDAVAKHEVTESGEEHRHHKGEDVGDVDHRVEGGWLGHVAVKGGDDGVTRKLCEKPTTSDQYPGWQGLLSHQNLIQRECLGRTPLMSNPKLSGNRLHRGAKLVGITSHKLPGASRLMVPSAMMTARRTNEDMIPRREVRERIRSGRNVVGTRL